MKFWSSEYTFSHPWEQVTTAAWRKYPNPWNPSVIGIDVLERNVNNGVLSTHRLIGSQWSIPKWVESIIGSPSVMYAHERSELNPVERTMTLKTRNITFCKNIAVDETVRYVQHPQDPEKTLLQQEAVITVEGMPLCSYLEGVLASTISSNAGKGREAMEWVLRKINEEIKELSHTVERSVDEKLHSAKKSLEEWVKEPVKPITQDLRNKTI